MSCWRCGGSMEEQRVTFCACTASPPVVVKNVPASVCRQCGERSYSTPVLNTLKRIRDGKGPAPRLDYLYAYDFDEAAGNQKGALNISSLAPSFYARDPGTTTLRMPSRATASAESRFSNIQMNVGRGVVGSVGLGLADADEPF